MKSAVTKTRTVSTTGLRKKFRQVAAWLNIGDEIEVLRRGQRFARLVSAPGASMKPAKVDFKSQLKEIWGKRVFSKKEMHAMRQAELEVRDR